MKEYPRLDKRTREDVIEEIRSAASSYAPGWRFREDMPDAGAALALLYAEMMEDTIRRFHLVAEKNRIAFFNRLQTGLQPARPARGYVTFELVSQEAPGAVAPAGVRLTAQGNDGERLILETEEEVFVTPSVIQHIFTVIPEDDKIYRLYEWTQETPYPLRLTAFDRSGENLQYHQLSFGHESLLHISGEARISLSFTLTPKIADAEAWYRLFLEEDNVSIEYHTEKGYEAFHNCRYENGGLLLHKEKDQPPFARTEECGYSIRIRIKEGHRFCGVTFSSLQIRSAQELEPELIYADQSEQGNMTFLPFGEHPLPYGECYIGSNEILDKKGAFVHVSFDLDFLTISLEREETDNAVDWKLVMKRSDIKVDQEYDISIQSVVWEYFNGDGFKPLFLNQQYAGLFTPEESIRRKNVSLHFICPQDMAPFLVNADFVCCIRARIVTINNFYKMKGRYITPRMHRVRLRYDYNRDDIVPDWLLLENNLEKRLLNPHQLRGGGLRLTAAAVRTEAQVCMYFAFSQPLEEGPVRLLFSMEHSQQNRQPELMAEYLTAGGWRSLSCADETEGLRKSGTITFSGKKDYKKAVLFGVQGYWLRFMRADGDQFTGGREPEQTFIKGIYLNSVSVLGVETMDAELFHIGSGGEHPRIQLSSSQVYELEVWAEEQKYLPSGELALLEEQKRVEYDTDDSESTDSGGRMGGLWIKWEEKASPLEAARQKRSYLADRALGTIGFPEEGGACGLTPLEDMPVKVIYRVSSGAAGNLPPGTQFLPDNSIGYISQAVNYEAITGGTDQETMEEALGRSAAALRNGGRAVTAADFEELAKEASPNIQKAKCFSNYNYRGQREYGAVTLVLLQKDFLEGGMYFDSLRETVLGFLTPRMEDALAKSGRFWIVEPCFLALNVLADITAEPDCRPFALKGLIEKELGQFLNPVTGNFDRKGFAIGSCPRKEQISNVIRQIPGVRAVNSMRLTASRNIRGRRTEVDMGKLEERPYIVMLDGYHEITVRR